MRRQSGNVVTIIAVIVAVVVIAGILGYVAWSNFGPGTKTTTTQETKTAEDTEKPDDKKVATKSFCTTYEKLCFEYPANWKLDDNTAAYNALNQYTQGDKVSITSPDDWMVLSIETGISGIGGTCGADDNTQVTAYALDGIPITAMLGFKTDFEQSTDQLYVARVITHDTESAPYVPYAYISNQKNYTTEGSLVGLTGLCFSNIVPGRHAEIPGSDPVSYGATVFGVDYDLSSETKVPTYTTLDDAKAAFDTEPYQQAISILSSLRYQ